MARRSVLPSRQTRLLVACAVVLAVSICSAAAWLLAESRQAAYNAALRAGDGVILTLEHDLRRTLDSLDRSLRSAVAGAQLPELASFTPAVQQAVLFDGALLAEEFGSLAITDATGRVIYDSLQEVDGVTGLSDREAFEAHRQDPHLGLLVSSPARGSGERLAIELSRRINAADGSFAGIATGTIQLDAVQHSLRNLALGKQGSIALFTLSGRLLARVPPAEAQLGADLGRLPPFPQLAQAPPGSLSTLVFDSNPSLVDGVRRTLVFRQVGSYQLGLVLGMSQSDMFAEWRQHAATVIGGLALLCALAGGLTLGLRRELRRRSAAEMAATASAERVRLLTDNASDLLIQLDWDGSRRYVSPASERLFGYDAATMTGRNWLEFVHPEDQERLRTRLQDLRRGRPYPPTVSRVRHLDAGWRHCETTAHTLPDGSGAVVVARDVSQRVQFEAKMRQAHRMEALGQLTAGVAHDFNNMLQAQLGALELLVEQVEEDPLAHTLASQAMLLGERGARLTHQLLSFSRQQILSPKPVDLTELLASMAETLRRTLGPHINVETIVSQGTPALLADRAHLESALLNLSLNARDAMPHGGTLRLSARAGSEGELQGGRCVVLTVEDEGEGMDPATLDRACEPFFSTKGSRGTGLGLASVQGFVTQSGGAIHIRSAKGEGTTIALLLPPAVADDPVSPGAGRAPQVMGQHRLLLVDDAPDVLVVVSAFLKGAGFEVVQAATAEQALQVLDEQGKFGGLITDYAMPGMNGGELVRLARARHPSLRCLVITGWAALDELSQLAGHTEILRKPFKREALLDALLRMLNGAENRAGHGDAPPDVMAMTNPANGPVLAP